MRRRINSAYEDETVIVMDFEPYWSYYSPELSEDQMDGTEELQDIDSWDVDYQDKMEEMIDGDENAQDLANYVDEDLEGKITKIDLTWNRQINYGLGGLRVITHVAPGVDPNSIIEPLTDYLEGQMTDGWGEGFEQQEIAEWSCYVVYSDDDRFFIEDFGGDWRAADNRAEELNEEYHEDYDDDEDSDYSEEGPYFSCEARSFANCSFWRGKGNNNPIDIKIFESGYDSEGYDFTGRDREGYNREGYNKEGYDREGFSRYGRDREGYDREGYDMKGRDRQGFDKSGYKDMNNKRPTDGKGREQGGKFRIGKDGKVSVSNIFDEGY